VVLKFDHPFGTDYYRHECFEREAAILEKFRGEPNIIRLVDGISTFVCSVPMPTGSTLPIPFRFISLEKARYSLFEYLQQPKKKYGPLRSLTYFKEICKGVQRLHAAKVCHRDLKPQNCLIVTGSCVSIGDLGTAKLLYADSRVPVPTSGYREPVGDMTYTAPELLCGLNSNTDIAFVADMYSLGAILFELFAEAI
jgi:serine/threonine protein kinase